MATPPPLSPALRTALGATPDQIGARLEATLVELVGDLQIGRPPGRGRPPILPAMVLWAGLIVCVLRGWTSQRALWRLLTGCGLWHFPMAAVSDTAVAKRLETGSPAILPTLFADLTTLLQTRVAPWQETTWAPFAQAVVALDETTLDQTARFLPALRAVPAGDDRLLPGKVAGLFDLRTQLWRTIIPIAHPRQNEKVAARALLADLPPQSLVLADLGYFGFAWFDDLTDQGFFWVSRLRAKTSYTVVHVLYEDHETRDALVWLGAHRADRAKHAVRLLQYRHGPVLRQYVTNVGDPALLPLREVARLYARRWDIELAVKLVKRDLHLHLLWSAKPAVIHHQLWATFIIAQILQALRVEIAGRAGVDLFEVSLPLLVAYLPHYAAQGSDPIAAFLHDGVRLGYIRPSRRTIIRAPTIPLTAIRPPPPDLLLTRTPRYAQRNCHRTSSAYSE